MSIREIIFRFHKSIHNSREKFFTPQLRFRNFVSQRPSLDFDLRFSDTIQSHDWEIFGRRITLNGQIDFHKDIFSGKNFPITFSKTIDIRSDKFGSAKVVWEINRLQFLIPLVLKYKISGSSIYLEQFVSILKSWDQQNPYLKGVNWYSNIEINIRLINWYWCWLLLQGDPLWEENEEYIGFRKKIWLPLIYKHCCFSYRNPSYYSSANNHLVAEYAGLFIASTLWKFPESEKWLRESRKGLEREIQRQHSENGINKEEAAEYIQFITDFFLLAFIAGRHCSIAFSTEFEKKLETICTYINNFLDCNNNFPKYGDEDDGRVIVPDGNIHANNFISILNTATFLFNRPDFKRQGSAWDVKSTLLTAHIKNAKEIWSGYDFHAISKSIFYAQEGHFIFRTQPVQGREIYAHFDAAQLGYLSIAAHGHADALSLLLHIDGYPFLVDPGTYTYHTHKIWRKYFVSTLAHNTITVNGYDQATLAGPTLWVNHYDVTVHNASTSVTSDLAEASHNGYKKLGVSHKRSINFDKKNNNFLITDVINARNKFNLRLQMPFHLDPAVIVTINDDGVYTLRRPETNASVELHCDPSLKWTLIKANDTEPLGWFSPSFMKKEKSSVILGESNFNHSSIPLKTFIKIII
jgi:hypothetical protein